MSEKPQGNPQVTQDELKAAAGTTLQILAQPIAMEREQRRHLAITESLLDGIVHGRLIVVDASKVKVESEDTD